MSTQTPPIPTHRTHRHTRSAALPATAAPSQNPQNPHHLNLQARSAISQLEMKQSPQPTTPPRTPQKTDRSAATTQRSQTSGSESVSKPRPKAKNRARNSLTSPALSRNDRNTPPLTSVQSGGMPTSVRPISTPSATAYAGPTFHASPAPSTLPIPSFYSKSVPDSPGIKGFQLQKEETSSGGDDSPTPPVAKPALYQSQGEQSPLDLFFKADREEKARARSASSFHNASSASGPFPLPFDSPRTTNNTPPHINRSSNRDTHFSGGTTSALFAMELDGTNSPGKPYGPAFSTPYHERINLARSSATTPQCPPQTSHEQAQSTERSEALKAYLFSSKAQTPSLSLPAGSPDTSGISIEQKLSDSTFLHSSHRFIGNRNHMPLSRSQNNSFPQLNNSFASRDSPRAGSRSSGLRQEFMTIAEPAQTPVGGGISYPPTGSPSWSSRNNSQNTTHNLAGRSDSVPVPLQTSGSHSSMQSGDRTTDYKEMEDSLRRILKLDPVGSSGA